MTCSDRVVEQPLNIRKATPAIIFILVFSLSLFLVYNPFIKQGSSSEFYVGVEFAYSNDLKDSQVNLNSLKSLVDKVQNYTNLFIIGIPEISLNETTLNESCDYMSSKGDLHFIILFTATNKYTYNLTEWTTNAEQKYGNKFLGVYRIDEPGGKELDNATFNNRSERFLVQSDFDLDVKNYSGASQVYVDILGRHIDILGKVLYPKIYTSDYGLYWFDYKGGYKTVFTQFIWNQSRQIAISLCRGAAEVQNKDWGVMITWMYDKEPYLESGQQLYSDLTLAYKAGAKYAVVFDYPNSTQYGVLTDDHFQALKNFWNYVKNNPQDKGDNQRKVAFVLPQDYGFGFRTPNDTIWGIWNSDDLSNKVWNDTNNLINQYGLNLDIVYNDSEYMNSVTSRYYKLFFWNETIR